jgi:hypothetical protein
MPNINDIHSIIVSANAPVFSAHTYSEIYGGSAGCVINVNGTVVSIGAASSINIMVSTVSGGTGCYLLGEKNNVYQGSTGIGGIY